MNRCRLFSFLFFKIHVINVKQNIGVFIIYELPALIDDGRLHPGTGYGQLRVGQRFLFEPGDGATDLVMMMMVMMVQSGYTAG